MDSILELQINKFILNFFPNGLHSRITDLQINFETFLPDGSISELQIYKLILKTFFPTGLQSRIKNFQNKFENFSRRAPFQNYKFTR